MKSIIWTDGSSRGNPGSGGFGAILYEDGFVKEIGGREDMTTNNRMEIKACMEALKICKSKNVVLYTDSSYLVNSMTGWIFFLAKKWLEKKTGENGERMEDVLNRDLFEELLEIIKDKKIEWIKISGHSGIEANERCDEIATSFADRKEIKLFDGKFEDYKISLDFKESDIKDKKKKSSKEKAYSYISKIDGQIFIDKTWEECKKRVSGVKGVKYKKSISEEDEEKIIKEFRGI